MLKARATDRAGNTGPESSWIWEIDLLPPNLNFSNADNDKNIGITNQNFRWVNETSIVLDFAALESTYQCHIQQYSVAMKKFFNVSEILELFTFYFQLIFFLYVCQSSLLSRICCFVCSFSDNMSDTVFKILWQT